MYILLRRHVPSGLSGLLFVLSIDLLPDQTCHFQSDAPVGWLFGFYGISTFVGHSTTNSV